MNEELYVLTLTAASLGFIHTLLGPDHYLPFIVISKARNWNIGRTLLITFLCGLGHVASSVIIGFIGIGLGIGVAKLEIIESFRGNIAGWLLLGFGFAYMIYGIRAGIKNQKHCHVHIHSNGSEHTHEHVHHNGHTHVHEFKSNKKLTPWILFTIFVFGPCEVLIPVLMYPAANMDLMGGMLVTAVFGLTTILTMLSVVILSVYGLKNLQFGAMERWMHAMAGGIIFFSGLGIQVLGL